MSYVGCVRTKKWLTSHFKREHQPIESKPNVLEKPTIPANNNRTLIVGPSKVGNN